MSQASVCPSCGAPIPARASEQLCPACLITSALDASDDLFPRDFGAYRLFAELGSGGMGTVYEAEDARTKRRVALKVLSHALDTTETRQRFLREGRLAAGVNHPNSLYVFGSEEIEGIPVITMEIASGGTLNDRLKKRGPLAVAEAVDAMLDVILGLDAVFATGVLHRDIKPSNCFVSADGSVKIGDFGLSVSTLAKEDSHLTGSGVIMGTPAFASPEQLRGRELDVRADIYSVGATLFTLLTGKAPLVGRNAVEVVAAVLEEAPPSLRELRADVPVGLARVVARCLAKQPERRYERYAALRAALLPFSSVRPDPAPLGHRLFAGFLDIAICGILPAVALHAFFGIDLDDRILFTERGAPQIFAWIGLSLGFVAYFTVCEGVWGAGLGKALMGLRVTRAEGPAQGVVRAFGRSVLFTSFGNFGKLACFVLMTASQYEAGGMLVVALLNPAIALTAFATMRRKNGWATAWDLATSTRVVTRAARFERSALELRAPSPELAERLVGPFVVREEILPSQWIAAEDPALRRRVWLIRATVPPSSARRDVARPGRLRWLQSVESAEGRWEVFEAPSGAPLPAGGALDWHALAPWLHDLAAEIESSSRDATLPERLRPDKVWIAADGRALLLDDAWPRAGGTPGPEVAVADLAGRQRFLHDIASRAKAVTLPLHARPVLESLAQGSFDRMTFLVGSLRALLGKRGRIDRRLRAASLFAAPSLLLVMVTLLVIGDRAAGGTIADCGLPEALLIPVLTLFALGALVALPQLLTLLTVRATPGMFVFGIGVVDARGRPVARARLLARWAIAWALPVAAFACQTRAASVGFEAVDYAALGLLLPWLIGLVLAVVTPARGPHDALTGCWLVAR